MKDKTCRYCKAKFTPKLKTAIVCGENCALGLIDKRQQRDNLKLIAQDRREIKTRLRALKTRSQWIKEVQVVFNKFIRLRDVNRACICCGLPLGESKVGGNYDCGHYRSVGSAPHLRFDERNAHAQRKQCNRYGSGRAVDYRIGLINRIGQLSVDLLEADQTPKHYSIDDLIKLKQFYKAKIKEIMK